MIDRRRFLQSATTGAIVPAMLWPYERLARAAGAASSSSASRPKRLLIFWNPQGNMCGTSSKPWDPKNDVAPPGGEPFWPTGTETNFQLSPILKPLERHKKDLILLKGFGDTPYYTQKICAKDVQDGQHGMGTKCRLTNVCPVPNPDDAAHGGTLEWGGGISIDQEIAGIVGKDTLRPSLVLIGSPPKNGNHRGFISYAGAGQPIAPRDNVKELYSTLFAAATTGSTAEIDALRAARKSSLDTVTGDISRLRARLSTAEKQKMDAQLAAIRVLEHGLDLTSTCSSNDPGIPAGNLPSWGLKADPPSRHTLMMKTVAAAFACDLTRVVSFMTASGGGDTINDLRYFGGWADNYHSTGHASVGQTSDHITGSQAGAAKTMTAISTYYSSLIAEFIDELKAIPESDGNGTVFDNTLIYWCTEMSHGNHGNYNMTHVLMGGGWKFKTGRFLDFPVSGSKYPIPPDNPFGDILTSVAQAMGHDISTFGWPERCRGLDAVYGKLIA